MVMMVDPRSIKTRPPFSDLFPIDPAIRASILESMKEDGFHPGKPIEVWAPEDVCLDGHHRLDCAIELGIAKVPVEPYSFTDENAAFCFAANNQVKRRNLTSADILRLVEKVDSLNPRGVHTGNQYSNGKSLKSGFFQNQDATKDCAENKSSNRTAQVLGISRNKVEQARAVNKDPEIKLAVEAGRMSLNQAQREVQHKKKAKNRRPPPIIVDPAPAPAERPSMSSVIQNVTPEESAWLESFPLRARVVAHRFDEDALIVRRLGDRIASLLADLRAIVGCRSESGQTVLYARIMRFLSIAPVECWVLCDNCKGTGSIKGHCCRSCRSGGFHIPLS